MNVVFSRMEGNLQLDLHLDSRPVSQELKGYMTELEKYTDKLTVQEADSASDSAALLPFVEVLTASGEKTGLAFHGVQGDTSLPLLSWDYTTPQDQGSPLTLPSENVSSLSTIRCTCRSWYPFPVPCARIW